MLVELSDITWDIVCFSETWALTADTILEGGHRLIAHKGRMYGGVAVLIHQRYADQFVKYKAFGDRVLAVRFKY